MTSKNIPEQTPDKPANPGTTRKPQNELDAKDLDKVTGGLRPSTIGDTSEPLAGG
jgi:hypothetical protein